MYIHMCVCFLVHVLGLHTEAGRCQVFSSISFLLFLPGRVSFWIQDSLQVWNPGKSQQSLLPSSSSEGLKAFLMNVWLLYGFWDLDSGPHDCGISCVDWFYVNLTHWTLIEAMPPQTELWTSLTFTFLIDDWWRNAKLALGSATFWMMISSAIRKKSKQATKGRI